MYSFDKTYPKSKKNHRCTWCGEIIPVGEKYAKWKSVEDSWFTSKMHLDCDEFHLEDLEPGEEYFPYLNGRPRKVK